MPCRLVIAVPLVLLAGCFAQPADPDLAFVDEAKRDANLRAYDEMWQHVGRTYLNPLPQRPIAPEWQQIPPSNWQAVAARFRPRIESAARQGDVRVAMGEALDALGQPHVALLPPSLKVSDGQAAFKTRASECGVTLHLFNNAVIVTHVEPNSSADQVGVRPGWVLVGIDTLDVGETINDLRAALPRDGLSEARIVDHLDASLNRGVGARSHASFRDGDGHSHHVSLLGRAPSDAGPHVQASMLDGDVMYFACTDFLDPAGAINGLTDLIAGHPTARGLIVDLRGNPGGLGSVATDLLGHLVERDLIKIGTMLRHDAAVPLTIERVAPNFAGPVAVLVDRGTMSSGEVFARAIQDLHRGLVFGEQTPGVTLSSVVVTLQNGERMQYAPADYVPVGGGHLEGVGVMPDGLVPMDLATLMSGRDATLDAAKSWLATQNTAPSPQ